MSVPRGVEAYTTPSSPQEDVLRKQNALLKEANQVLKEALVSIVDRYKALSAQHAELQGAYELASRGVNGAKSLTTTSRSSASPNRVASPPRRLEDINTSVIKGVVERFADEECTQSPRPRYDESSDGSPPARPRRSESKGLRSARIELEARRALQSALTPNKGASSRIASITPTLVGHAITEDHSLAVGEELYRPSLLGEEDRIVHAGSPAR